MRASCSRIASFRSAPAPVDIPRPRERKELNHDPRFRAIRLGVLEYLLESGKAKRVAAATDQLDQSQTIAKSDSVQIAEVST